MKTFIAKRELLYSLKGEGIRRRFTVGISAPYLLTEGLVDFEISPGMAGCTIQFDGISERSFETYGVDELQAVELASNVDSYLKRLEKKYDLFWLSGDPYFED